MASVQPIPQGTNFVDPQTGKLTPFAYQLVNNIVKALNTTNGALTSATIAGISIVSGSGSPSGVVSAPPGSLYINSAGGAGATFWVKQTGTGNSGWSAVA